MDGWTAEQCAEYWGIAPTTWKAYASRNQAPKPVGWSDSDDDERPRRVWDPDEVQAQRPGARRHA